MRFFAAVYVVAFHYLTPALVSAPRAVLNLALSGYVAVDFFFILSGFILAYNYLTPTGELKGTKRQFWVARFARIYPAYALALLLCLPFVARTVLTTEPFHTALYHFFGSLGPVALMQQSWLPWMAMWGNAPAWSVSVESFFYLVFPLLAPVLGKLSMRTCVPLLLAVWMLGLAQPTASLLQDRMRAEHVTAPGEPNWSPGPPVQRPWVPSSTRSQDLVAKDFTTMVSPLSRLPEFVVGILLGRLLLGATERQRRLAARCVVPALFVIVALLAASDHFPRPLLRHGLFAPLFCVVIFGLSGGGSWLERLLSRRAFIPLGEASYSVYILQAPVAMLLSFEGGSILGFLGYLVVLMGASLLSFFKIETPVRKLLMARLLPPRTVAPALAPAPGFLKPADQRG